MSGSSSAGSWGISRWCAYAVKRPWQKGTSDRRTNPKCAKFCSRPYLQGEPFAIAMQQDWLARECEPARYIHSYMAGSPARRNACA